MKPDNQSAPVTVPPMDVQNDDVMKALAYIRGVPETEENSITRVRLQNMHSRVSCRERQLLEARERIGRLEGALKRARFYVKASGALGSTKLLEQIDAELEDKTHVG